MTLKIEIPCNNGIELENNLNKAISDLSKTLIRRGFSEMELIAYDDEIVFESNPIYTVTLKP